MDRAERPPGWPGPHCPASPCAPRAVCRRAGVAGTGALGCRDRPGSLLRGRGSHGSIGAVTLEDGENRELARWGAGEGELPEALAAPIWGRYALFRGHPRIMGLLMWDPRGRKVVIAGERGGQKFDDVLVPKPFTRAHLAPVRPDAAAPSGSSRPVGETRWLTQTTRMSLPAPSRRGSGSSGRVPSGYLGTAAFGRTQKLRGLARINTRLLLVRESGRLRLSRRGAGLGHLTPVAGLDPDASSWAPHERRTTRRGRDPDARFSTKRSCARGSAVVAATSVPAGCGSACASTR